MSACVDAPRCSVSDGSRSADVDQMDTQDDGAESGRRPARCRENRQLPPYLDLGVAAYDENGHALVPAVP